MKVALQIMFRCVDYRSLRKDCEYEGGSDLI